MHGAGGQLGDFRALGAAHDTLAERFLAAGYAAVGLATGLATANNRWCEVAFLSYESVKVKNVHVLGDATFSAPAMPKSGHMANQQAKVAAAAIIQLLKGEAVNATPVVMNTCYSFVTARDVVHVASVHQFDATEKTFKPVPGSGGVSSAATVTRQSSVFSS